MHFAVHVSITCMQTNVKCTQAFVVLNSLWRFAAFGLSSGLLRRACLARGDTACGVAALQLWRLALALCCLPLSGKGDVSMPLQNGARNM